MQGQEASELLDEVPEDVNEEDYIFFYLDGAGVFMEKVITLTQDVIINNKIFEAGDKVKVAKKQETRYEPDDINDAFISCDGWRYFVSAAGENIGEFEDFSDVEEALKAWMKRNNWYPTVWYIDDHGGVEPYTSLWEKVIVVKEPIKVGDYFLCEGEKIKIIEKTKAVDMKDGWGQITGIGMDANGNKVIRIKANRGNSFSIQTNQNIPTAHKASDLDDIKDNLDKIEKEVLDYVKKYGTKNQKAIVPNKKEGLDVFQKHQLAIAKKTLRMPDAMVGVMGGMNKDEARAFLKSIGWSDKQIAALEESKMGEVTVKTDRYECIKCAQISNLDVEKVRDGCPHCGGDLVQVLIKEEIVDTNRYQCNQCLKIVDLDDTKAKEGCPICDGQLIKVANEEYVMRKIKEIGMPFTATLSQFAPIIGPVENNIIRKAKATGEDYSTLIEYFMEELLWSMSLKFGEKAVYPAVGKIINKIGPRKFRM
jgi:Zn finger protein HypA/HybF involved in hydrogenase expression